MLAEAELCRLRTQHNPHVLYNSLNAISELGYNDPNMAGSHSFAFCCADHLDDCHQNEIALCNE